MINAYCDGARKKTGLGGYGILIEVAGNRAFEGGYLEGVTNNYTELEAAIRVCEAIAWMNITGHVTIHSDSSYFVNGFNEWIERWKNRNWTKIGGPKNVQIANLDQWKKLLEFKEALNVKAKWVRGHSGDESNEFCDRVANFCHDNQCAIYGVIPPANDMAGLDLKEYIININC